MNTMRVTVADFREIQGLKSQVEANSVINLLKSQGIAVEVGKKRRADGRGKPAKIYEIPQTVELTLFQDSDMGKSIPAETTTVETDEVSSETDEVEVLTDAELEQEASARNGWIDNSDDSE